MSDWGDQFGSLAYGIGAGAADYELAKHDPKGYMALQKWSLGIFLGILLLIVVILVVVGVVSAAQRKNNPDK